MDYPVIQETLLERVSYGISAQLSQEIGPVDVAHYMDYMTRRMVFKFKRDIYQHRVDATKVEIRERPTYLSPRHAWVAHFPEGSFLRRFWLYFFGMDRDEQLETTRVHTVRLARWAVLPDFIPPPGAGPVFFHQSAEYYPDVD